MRAMSKHATPYRTARCILYRDDRYLLAVHSRFWLHEPRWGLPGGQIEWGESAHDAAVRELHEELQVHVPRLAEVGPYRYKHAQHMVFAAPCDEDIVDFDDSELLEVSWFTEPEIADLSARSALHADYELDAVRRLRTQLGGALAARAAF